jgi:Obg family GTPase CgtA
MGAFRSGKTQLARVWPWCAAVWRRSGRPAFCGASAPLSSPVRQIYSNGAEQKRKKLMPLQERKMIDKFKIHVRGGDGGAGCSSFRKSIQARHGSADGGNGGSGGDVILISCAAVWDFSNLQHHLSGTKGGQGSSKKKVGSRGKDRIVQVPVGTVIHTVGGSIPLAEQAIRREDESIWEDWDVSSSDHETSPVTNESQCARTSLSAESQVVQVKCVASTNSSDKYGDAAIPRFSQNFQTLEPCVDSFKGSFGDPFKLRSATQSSCSLSESFRSMDCPEGDGGCFPSYQEDDYCSVNQYVQNVVVEFTKIGQSIVVARGGSGGKGNAAIARGIGSEKIFSSLEHELGQRGSEADLILELKTIADVGLVGAPSAGKSTLLGSLSTAKPTTGHYKFTTLRPNIGTLEFEDFFSLTVADIPGLIEDAHKNKGLGHAFLRHIERTKVLVYVLDLASGVGDDTGPLPWDQFEELVFELEQYQKGLSQRPSIVVANKIDEEGVVTQLEMLQKKLPFLETYATCVVLNEGVEDVKRALRRLLESP